MSRGYTIDREAAVLVLLGTLGFPHGCCCGPESMCPNCMKGEHLRCANTAIRKWEDKMRKVLEPGDDR